MIFPYNFLQQENHSFLPEFFFSSRIARQFSRRWHNYASTFFLYTVFLLLIMKPGVTQEKWVQLRDSQNNHFYRDILGRMHVLGHYKKKRRPLSLDNVEFYYQHSLELLRSPEIEAKIRALEIWHTMLHLPVSDRSYEWRKKATATINFYRKKWGDGYTRIFNKISYFRIEDLKNREFKLIIPHASLAMYYPADWNYIERRRRSERYSVIEIIILGKKGAKTEQMAIAYERFKIRNFLSEKEYSKTWHARLAYADRAVTRKLLAREDYEYNPFPLGNRFTYIMKAKRKDPSRPLFPKEEKKFAYLFQDRPISGEEYYLSKKRVAYYISWMVDAKRYPEEQKKFHDILRRIKIQL